METLDLRSIGLTLSLSGFALTAVLWAARRGGDSIAGLNAWILSAATMSAGLGLSAAQGWLPDWAARVLGNTALAAAPMFAWQGSRNFRGLATSYRWVVLVSIWTLVGGLVFVYVWPSVRLRIAVASATMALACAAAGAEFLRQRQAHLGVAARLGGIPLMAFALMMGIRSIDALMRSELELGGALIPTAVNVATYLMGSVVLLCAIAGMVMSVMATRAEQIRDLAYRDVLTGALSRRGLYAALPLWARRYAAGATVVVLDANDFKQINDLLGHQRGDQVLQALAAACTAALPKNALVARFGGDEFVALVPHDVALGTTLATIEAKFRVECERLLRDSPVSHQGVAIGHAPLGGTEEDNFETALRAADSMMYALKGGPRLPGV